MASLNRVDDGYWRQSQDSYLTGGAWGKGEIIIKCDSHIVRLVQQTTTRIKYYSHFGE